MPYLPHTDEEIGEMLSSLGLNTIEELFNPIPQGLRLKEPLNLPLGLSEEEVFYKLKALSSKNLNHFISFLGGGAYRHYIPSVVNHILLRSEYYSSYTPYQPEISQGTLQAIFEYQTLICQLTGMDVANASMYDGASAVAEAVLMAKRINGRAKVILSSALHPEYRDVIKTYLSTRSDNIKEVLYCTETGRTLPEAIEGVIDEDTSCVVCQYPNFFGCIEDLKAIEEVVHKKGAIFIVSITEPVSLGLLKPPGEFGADIVVGEGQSFGIPLSFGGPSLGFFATREAYLRQMPGRIVGETVDSKGERAFVLTLATREQHIRRERSTSNICTNSGLCAIAALVTLSLLGKEGLKELAILNLKNSEYAKKTLLEIPWIKTQFTSPTFNEFVIDTGRDIEALLKYLKDEGILGGIPLNCLYRELKDSLLISVTELNTRDEIDRLRDALERYG